MNLWQRVLLGAALGALTVLLLHPASRSTLLTPMLAWGPSSTISNNPWALTAMDTLPKPATVVEASLWMEAGAKGLAMRQTFTDEDLDKLILVAEKASEQDRDNAYWRQMRAIFLDVRGRKAEAVESWIKASRATRWEAYQSQRINAVRSSLAKRYGGDNAWQWLAVHQLRNPETARQIEVFGRNLAKTATLKARAGLEIRYATLLNGKLLRDGAKSIAIGEAGANLVELASHPADLGRHATPRRLLVARNQFIGAMQTLGMADEAEKASKAFLTNDAWTAFAPRDSAKESLYTLGIAALITGTVPGALLIVSLFGFLVWLFSELLKRNQRLQTLIEPPLAPAMGVGLSLATYQFTRLPLAAVAVASCFAFLSFTPVRERTHVPDQLGPLFRLTVGVLGAVVAALALLFMLGASTPGTHVLPLMDLPQEYYGGSTVFLALAAIVFTLLLLVGPSWAMVQRLPTPAVVIIALREFGLGLCIVCLTLALVVAPFAVYFDLQTGAELQKLVTNEPVYHYYNQ